ncbi:uncharacterized protein LOC119833671 isoform X1 [Zerene cesonia]|uniref:uncharacterized protein LOC119833671 isoform X1 n=1 Tax=Zerene cesonia TaxID=33412 RepID=UPI0018E586BC|nr:uncharacterized protein LOC119833671 isoform X1 [Zerene cesonia]
MPASSIDLYHMHDAKNNFDAIRPAPVYCSESNYFMGPCRNVHISTNCYYGYHDPSKRSNNEYENTDTEMLDVTTKVLNTTKSSLNLIENNARKRSADDSISPATKRLRQEVQTMKSNEPETNENMKLDSSSEDLLETLYWHLHGGNFYQCV